MKLVIVICAIALAALGGWWIGSRHDHSTPSDAAAAERKVLFYQSPMHPWVKSDKPGNCTVCGMQLVPVYESGSAAGGGATTDIVMLPEGSPMVTNVKTVEVQRQPLVRTLRVAGIIDDDASRHRVMSAYTGGRIEKLFVNYEGADVEKGQPLATFYSKDLLNAANDYKVVARQGGSGLLTAAESRLLQLGLTPEQIAKVPKSADDNLFFEIVAPMTGTVVKRYVYEGQYVEEGEKLFEIADFSRMWFQFIAYEQDLPFLKVGQMVKIRSPAMPGRVIDAPIVFINPNLDDATRSARVRVEFDNPRSEQGLHRGHELLHRVYADAVVALDAPDVVAVPKHAVIWTGTNPRVYVEQESGSYQQRRVILGRAGDEHWEVLEGVQPGERVVASGNMLIDSQAQLNNLGAPPESAPPAEAVPELTATDHEALERYFAAMAGLAAALASDDLTAYNAALAELPSPPKAIFAAKPQPAPDLAAARKAFQPPSEAAAQYALKVRGHFPEVHVFRCPMTDQAGEGMPKNARWIQLSENLRNPFFGREMIGCGVEVK